MTKDYRRNRIAHQRNLTRAKYSEISLVHAITLKGLTESSKLNERISRPDDDD